MPRSPIRSPMATKHYTVNGCYHSNLSVTPKDWRDNPNMDRPWRIHYRFFDPLHTEGRPKQVTIKQMNVHDVLIERQAVTEGLIEDELFRLQRGYNPYTKKFMTNVLDASCAIDHDTPLLKALEFAHKGMKGSQRHLYDIELMLRKIKAIAPGTDLERKAIGETNRKTVRLALNRLDLTPYQFNKQRAYLSSLFGQLVQLDAIEYNPVLGITKKRVPKNYRQVMQPWELNAVMRHLRTHNYNFYRFCMIFMYSGARTTELLAVKTEDVSIENRQVMVRVNKGGGKLVPKPIIKAVMPLWMEVIDQSSKGDYLFSTYDEPGSVMRKAACISRKWSYWVKGKPKDGGRKELSVPLPIMHRGRQIKITADFYSLKHSLLASLDSKKAQLMASHDHVTTTAGYRHSAMQREIDILKDLDIDLLQMKKPQS